MATIKKFVTVFQFRRDTNEEWLLNKDVIPAAGEPCYDIDKKTLRIGDGTSTYENLPIISGVDLATDGKSIIVEEGELALAGFDAAEAGTSPIKGEDGSIQWVKISSTAQPDLSEYVTKTELTTIEEQITQIEETYVTNEILEQSYITKEEVSNTYVTSEEITQIEETVTQVTQTSVADVTESDINNVEEEGDVLYVRKNGMWIPLTAESSILQDVTQQIVESTSKDYGSIDTYVEGGEVV